MAPLHVLPLLLLSFLSSIVSVSAHFKLEYPPARGDSFLPPASQWVYPCANINTTTNRTLYSLDSFNVGLDLHHNWTYVFVNLGLGTNGSSDFNISLTPSPLNVTGKGNLCLQDFDLPTNLRLENGLDATIQVVTVGASGSALYNCADITFSSNSSVPTSEQCPSDTGISIATLTESTTSNSSSTSTISSPSGSSTSNGSKNSGVSFSTVAVLLSAVGIASLLSI